MKRRTILQQLALFSGSLIIPVSHRSWVAKNVAATTISKNKLIVIFLRGGIDGLNVVVPYGEDEYYDNRPTIALPPPNKPEGVLNLNGNFGLHPALKSLMPLWEKKQLTFIHGCGLQKNTRSHFDAQYYMETGVFQKKKSEQGWMNRLLGILSAKNPTQGVNMGSITPQIFRGLIPVANLPRGKDNINKLNHDNLPVYELFDQLYSGNDPLSLAYQQGQKTRKIFIKELTTEMEESSQNAPSSYNFVTDVKKMSKLMVGDANTQLGFMDLGRWDTHVNQSLQLNQLLKPLGEGLATFAKELGDIYHQTTIIVMSEFGRTVKENVTKGTDHGSGNIMWILGGNIKGGQFYGEWPTLNKDELLEDRDLAITTDFREPINHIFRKNFNLSAELTNQVFPNFEAKNNLDFI